MSEQQLEKISLELSKMNIKFEKLIKLLEESRKKITNLQSDVPKQDVPNIGSEGATKIYDK